MSAKGRNCITVSRRVFSPGQRAGRREGTKQTGTPAVRAVSSAASAQKSWAALSLNQRAEYLLKAADFLASAEDEITKLQCVESGKRLEELYAQALPLAETLILEFVAKLDTDQPLSKAYDHTFGEF
jgi:acyl-CoA reductase-like NAD-dependent aldehyde dehydrogenase